MHRRKLLSLALVTAPIALFGQPALAVPKKKVRGLLANNVTGSITDTGPEPDVVAPTAGTVRITRFIFDRETGTLSVEGILNVAGVPADTLFRAPATFSQPNAVRATRQKQASCSILNLDIGPINLDLLGLLVDISPISIDITALRGPGNLLGNLLCALAGLLDPLGPLDRILAIVRRLNQALATRLVTV